jgi:hypothetical protein
LIRLKKYYKTTPDSYESPGFFVCFFIPTPKPGLGAEKGRLQFKFSQWYNKKMLDDKDINKLVSLLATKKDVEEIRSDIGDLKEMVQGLLVATDAIAKSIGELKMEYAAISTQLTRHERWIKQIAEKVGLDLAME